MSQGGHDRITHLARTDLARTSAIYVRCAHTLPQYLFYRRLDALGGVRSMYFI